jgi:phosphate-selective porin OprO/OprP
VLSYAAGVFNGVVDAGSTDIDNTDGKESAGRVFLLPFKKTDALSLQQLGVGVAATYGSTAGTPAAPDLPVYRTTSLQTFFSYITDAGAGGVPPATAAGTAVADGRRYRLSPQAYYYNGRFGLMAEYAISHQEVVRDTATADLRHTAWQGTVTILLTDDTASYKGVTPKRPFDPSAGNWGAFELALRGGAQRIDDDTFPLFSDISKSARVAREWRGGVNWHLNRNCKLMLDYAETRFDGGAASGEDREVEKVLQNRFQVSF